MKSLAKKIIATAKDRAIRLSGLDIKAEYITSTPSAQNALDIFAGEWASQLPPPFEHLAAGNAGLFKDSRISWLIEQLGGVDNMNILECGPLEGGHTYMLEKMGAASIISVEASTRAYLRCLVLKEILRLQKSHFLLGDFVNYLQTNRSVDLVLACGVLYHLVDPIEAIALMAKATDRLYIWTHYYDEDLVKARPKLAHHFTSSSSSRYGDFTYKLHRQTYQSRLGNPGFMGGSETFSNWLEREGLLGSLRHFGFDEITIQFDDKQSPAGPNISLLARRRAAKRDDSADLA